MEFVTKIHHFEATHTFYYLKLTHFQNPQELT